MYCDDEVDDEVDEAANDEVDDDDGERRKGCTGSKKETLSD